VEKQNQLGIYIHPQGATVVCLGSQGGKRSVEDCFSVALEEHQENDWKLLASLIARRCTENQLQFSDTAVAVDCALFMQHIVHSNFTDDRQINSTVRFDTEEALATDISDQALSFVVNCSDDNGSELTVFTAQKRILSEILTALQQNNIDPVTIEPDINCLAVFISENAKWQSNRRPLYALLSGKNGYLLAFRSDTKASYMRTFFVGDSDRNELLKRELILTAALLVNETDSVNSLNLVDSAGLIDLKKLQKHLGMETCLYDLKLALDSEGKFTENCDDVVAFATAYGAVLAARKQAAQINFRSDFSPYQGKKVKLQKTLKILSISLSVLLLSLGLYLHLKLFQIQRYKSKIRDKLAKDYLVVMAGEKSLPSKIKQALSKLGTEYRSIEAENKGILSLTGEKAVSARLQLLLEAFNECAKAADLSIDSVSITSKSISISGSTSNRPNTQKLRDALKKTNLGALQENLQVKGDRDNFNITIFPEK
jgi:hypothetical protein